MVRKVAMPDLVRSRMPFFSSHDVVIAKLRPLVQDELILLSGYRGPDAYDRRERTGAVEQICCL